MGAKIRPHIDPDCHCPACQEYDTALDQAPVPTVVKVLKPTNSGLVTRPCQDPACGHSRDRHSTGKHRICLVLRCNCMNYT